MVHFHVVFLYNSGKILSPHNFLTTIKLKVKNRLEPNKVILIFTEYLIIETFSLNLVYIMEFQRNILQILNACIKIQKFVFSSKFSKLNF